MTRPLVSNEELIPILFGHAALQQFSAACELELFEHLHRVPDLTVAELEQALQLSARSTAVLLQGTTALGVTTAQGGRYRNSPVIEAAFADGSWPTLAAIARFQTGISYLPASDYAESLRTGTNVGVRFFPGDTPDLYSRLGNVPARQQLFYRGMHAWSQLSNPVLTAVDLSATSRLLDVGGGDAVNAVRLAEANPDLQVTVLDRPEARAVAEATISAAGLTDRVRFSGCDIFTDDYPDGHDAVLFAHQLVIWSPEENIALLRRAAAGLPSGGRVLIFNAFSDDGGDGPLYSALDNVYFLTLPSKASRIYTWAEMEGWLAEAGFGSTTRHVAGGWTPHGVLEARPL